MTPAVRRFIRYAAVGVTTLGFDLMLLAAAKELFDVPVYLATPVAFLVAVSLNYCISRVFVFRGTRRRLDHGYAYFIGIALAGAFVTTGLTSGFMLLGAHYLAARLLAAGVVGAANYLANLYLNFQVVGLHPAPGRIEPVREPAG